MSIYAVHPQVNAGVWDYTKPHMYTEVSSYKEAVELLNQPGLPKPNNLPNRQQLENWRNQPTFLGRPMPWQISFYQDIDNRGDRFELGVLQQINPIVLVDYVLLGQMDWAWDLTKRGGPCNGNWNDCISSVQVHSYDKYFALFEHIHFQGDVLIGRTDISRLTDRPSNQGSWNDRVSSIVMCSDPAVLFDQALDMLISLLLSPTASPAPG